MSGELGLELERTAAARMDAAVRAVAARCGGGEVVVTTRDLRAAVEARARGDRGFFAGVDEGDGAPVDVLFARWVYAGGRVNAFDGESLAWWLERGGMRVTRVERDAASGTVRAAASAG